MSVEKDVAMKLIAKYEDNIIDLEADIAIIRFGIQRLKDSVEE